MPCVPPRLATPNLLTSSPEEPINPTATNRQTGRFQGLGGGKSSATTSSSLGGMMDPLVLAAASAVVASIAGEAWSDVRAAVVRTWDRVNSPRSRSIGDAVQYDAEGLHQLGSDEGAVAVRSGQLEEDWQSHFRALLRDHPDAREAVLELVQKDLIPLVPEPQQRLGITNVINNNTARDNSRFFLANQDINYHERD